MTMAMFPSATMSAITNRDPAEIAETPTARPSRPSIKLTALVIATIQIIVTGTLSQPRDHFERLIAEHGGKATGAISKSTSYLLAGSGGGSKREKALKLGVPVISEEEFGKLIGN